MNLKNNKRIKSSTIIILDEGRCRDTQSIDILSYNRERIK